MGLFSLWVVIYMFFLEESAGIDVTDPAAMLEKEHY